MDAPPRSPFRRLTAFLARHRTVCLFAAVVVLTDWLVGRSSAVWDRHSPDDYAARVEGCRERPRDLVFVGGSPVAEGINPNWIVGVDWPGGVLADGYALGLSGGTTSDVYHAVIHACPTPPRVLVYGITASDLNDSRVEPHGTYSLMTLGDVGRWMRVRPDAAGWVVRNYAKGQLGKASDLWRYRHGIRMWAATEADRLRPGSCPEAAEEAKEQQEYADAIRAANGYAKLKGFRVGDFAAMKRDGKVPADFPFLNNYKTGSHLKYLHKLIEWSDTNGVSLVLADMPVTAELEAMHPVAFAEYRGRLAELERVHAVSVIRATPAGIGVSDSEFADLIHLNPLGAWHLCKWLRVQLIALSRDAAASPKAQRTAARPDGGRR